MIELQYKLTSYRSLLEQLSAVLHTELVDNTLNIPTACGQGFFKLLDLPAGIQALVYNLQLKEDLHLIREKTGTEFYILTFDEVNKIGSASIRINAEDHVDTQRKAAIYLTSFLYNVELSLQRDTMIHGIRILLPISWMQEYLGLKEQKEVLEKYIALKTAGVWYMPVDVELKELLATILDAQPMPLLFSINKVLRIIERFFDWLYHELQTLTSTHEVSRLDIEAAHKVETIITKDITTPPPTIKELAREVAMSESKLKKIFKVVYGLPPYEYYQKQRMQKAWVLL